MLPLGATTLTRETSVKQGLCPARSKNPMRWGAVHMPPSRRTCVIWAPSTHGGPITLNYVIQEVPAPACAGDPLWGDHPIAFLRSLAPGARRPLLTCGSTSTWYAALRGGGDFTGPQKYFCHPVKQRYEVSPVKGEMGYFSPP